MLTNKAVLDRATFEALPELRYVGLLSTGTNVVDLEAAHARGVVVTNVPDYAARSVAQHVFALLLAHTNRVAEHARAVAEGAWAASPDFSFTVAPLRELAGRTLGVVGLGSIGRLVAELGVAHGMRVIAARPRPDAPAPRTDLAAAVERVPLDELFAAADVLSLHCPLVPETRQLVDARRLALMKPDAVLVNTARGGLVDEAAVRAELDAGRLGAVLLDVLSVEPPVLGSPLLGAPRCVVTPHVAWATREARARLIERAAANVEAFLAGRPRNVVAGPGSGR